MTKLLSLSLSLLSLLPSARAWNVEGHMLVAQIAYNHLEPNAKAKCDSLIAVPLTNHSTATSTFVTAAVWADDFRVPLNSANWHFINLPFTLDNTPTNGIGNAAFDVVRAINLNIQTLQNPNASLTNQATHLRYLLHFVGDIHNPVHCITAVSTNLPNGDAGGNLFPLTNWGNLHALWDNGGGYLLDPISRPLTVVDQNILDIQVSLLETAASYDYTAHRTIPNPMNWAIEGREFARTNCYVGIIPGSIPSPEYLAGASMLTVQRLAAAGRRLADLLNTIYPTPLVLNSVTLTAGEFKFSWNATSNVAYQVQWKSKLPDDTWNNLTTIIASSNSVSFQATALPGERYYRVVR